MSSSRDDLVLSTNVMSDTITLDSTHIPYLTSSMIGPYYNVGTGSGGSGGTGAYYTTNSTYNQPWQNLTMTNNGQSSLTVKGDAEFEGKVKINGQDIGEFMETISKRLAILIPDPAKLEHFESLKKAYNHYKTLEALCEIPKKEEEE